MFVGRNKCRELIKELQSTYDIKDHINTIQQIEDQEILDIQCKQYDNLLQEEYLCEIINSLEGATLCSILDHLSKVRKLVIFLLKNNFVFISLYLPAF